MPLKLKELMIATFYCVIPHLVQQVLGVGSIVQFGNPLRYGVIKVILNDPDSNNKFAEIETVSTTIMCIIVCMVEPSSRGRYEE